MWEYRSHGIPGPIAGILKCILIVEKRVLSFTETGRAQSQTPGEDGGQLSQIHGQVQSTRQKMLRKTEFTGEILGLTVLIPNRRRNKDFISFPAKTTNEEAYVITSLGYILHSWLFCLFYEAELQWWHGFLWDNECIS